ncbi:hypothetical protein MGMO_8c00470 [Methyloglobulus morosus KoM1]|uniref:Uncharacterized protein n=1 Tax=Methyloglobulus morosus KoM1 TaxID=1116472 RepID=V5BKQ5_9GAMM|nr:hypothetical protein [Methyloglobulus morosus]ESS73910.1 hypothetical protein MGMO_8c00470 [Methyloglobulus morosus KoM1]
MNNRQIYQKFIFHLSLLGITISVLVGFYDVIFGHILEALHLLFEVVEMALDKLIEHTFETELHETQLIVFYILLVLVGILIYFLWKMLVQLFRSAGHRMQIEWTEFVGAITQDWQAMTVTDRVLLVSAFLLVNYLASFLLF